MNRSLFAKLAVLMLLGVMAVACAAPASAPAPAAPAATIAATTAAPAAPAATTAATTAAPAAPAATTAATTAAPAATTAATAAPAASAATAVPAAPGAVKLTIWHPYSGATGKAFEALIGEFNKTHPAINVVPSYGGTLWTMQDKLLTAIAGKAAPDVSIIDQFWAAELADANSILKMQDFIDADKSINKDDIHDLAWKTATVKGQIWSMPFSMSNEALYYNKDLFTKAGLDPNKPPATWQELIDMGQKLTKDTNGDGKPDQWGLQLVLKADEGCVYDWIGFLWQNGGELFDDKFTKSRFNETAGVEALQLYVDLIYKYKIMSIAPPEKGFDNSLIAMTIGSTSGLTTRISTLGTDKLGVAPLPKGKKLATGVGGGNLAILAGTKNKDAAWEFVKYMTSADVNYNWSMGSGYLPLRKSVVNSTKYQEYLTKEPRAKVILDQLPVAIARPNIPAYAPGSRELGLAVEEAVYGNKDPKTTLDAAAKKVDVLLTEKK